MMGVSLWLFGSSIRSASGNDPSQGLRITMSLLLGDLLKSVHNLKQPVISVCHV